MSTFEKFDRVDAWNEFWKPDANKGFASGRNIQSNNTYDDINKLIEKFDNINSIEDWGCGSGTLYCHLNDESKKNILV